MSFPDLDHISDEQLRAELERREEAEEARLRPRPQPYQDYEGLVKQCEAYIEELANYSYDEDAKQYIYEAAIEAIYGKGVWKWINSRVR
jgi:hypothetical protein